MLQDTRDRSPVTGYPRQDIPKTQHQRKETRNRYPGEETRDRTGRTDHFY